MEFNCECGHTRKRHRDFRGGTTICDDCCPTDFNEHIHPFRIDNLKSLEDLDEQKENSL